jgi:hypothetical protein
MSVICYFISTLLSNELEQFIRHYFLQKRITEKTNTFKTDKTTIKLYLEDLADSENIQGFFENASIFFYSNDIVTEKKVYSILSAMLNTSVVNLKRHFNVMLNKILDKLNFYDT